MLTLLEAILFLGLLCTGCCGVTTYVVRKKMLKKYYRLSEKLAAICQEKEQLQQNLKIEEARWQEKQATWQQAQTDFTKTFKALSADALFHNNQSFLDLAKTTFEKLHQSAQGDLNNKQKSIGEMLAPVKDILGSVQLRLQDLEKARIGAYEVLRHQVNDLISSQKELRLETANLVKALRAPAIRGRWGEMQLRRVVELTGLNQHCDFVEQATLHRQDDSSGCPRPDMIVKLPGGKVIVIDAKVPLAAYLEALEATDDITRRDRMRDHARQVRAHVTSLSSRAYWDQLSQDNYSPEFVVLFLPGETFFSTALEYDPTLIELGVEKKVILTTPSTLIALLHAVAYGWRQESLAENAQQISELGRDLYKRLADMGKHVSKMGRDLNMMVKSYNNTVGSLERRVLPAARRFKDLETTSSRDEIEILAPVEVFPRDLQATELKESDT